MGSTSIIQKCRLYFAFLRHLFRDILALGIAQQASAMAYVTLLSLVPSLAITFSLLSFFLPSQMDQDIIESLRHMLAAGLTEAAGGPVTERLEEYINGLNIRTLGISGGLGLLASLLLLLRQIELSFNQIWQIDKNRNIFLRLFYFLLFLGMMVFLITMSYSLIEGLGWKLIKDGERGFKWVPGTLESFLITVVFFMTMFKVIPNCRVYWKPAAWGAIFSALMFTGAGKLFVYYGSHLANYQMIYGAFAALPLFLIWLNLCWMIILLGAVLSRRLQIE